MGVSESLKMVGKKHSIHWFIISSRDGQMAWMAVSHAFPASGLVLTLDLSRENYITSYYNYETQRK